MNETQDRLEIRDLIDHSMVLIDMRDYDGYGNLYTADGRYESPFAQARGPQEISAMSRQLTESGFTEGMRHFTGPISITVDGNAASAFSYFWVAKVDEAPTVYATGMFSDRLEKVDGQWKFTRRVQAADPNGRELADS